MKKIITIFLIILPNLAFAIDYSCFEKVGIIKNPENKTIKIITDQDNIYFYQDNKLLNSRLFKDYQRKIINYQILNKDKLKLSGGKISFDQYDTNKEIIINFPETLLKNTFNYEILSNTYDYKFEISKDGKNYFKINDDLKNYDLDYLKIIFQNGEKIKNIDILSLDFFKFGNYEILVNSKSNSEIKAYSKYFCNQLDELIYNPYFPTDINTKSYKLILEKNKEFDSKHINEYKLKDFDNDGLADINDNCPKDYNPTQLDSSTNGIGDLCDDKDNDSLKGKIDNCPTIYNPDQKDENKNGIGDACEIDTDKDSIYNSIDNCVNHYNLDQKDIDKDKIGDLCDNCINNYNPEQKDIDKDKIGDKCDGKDNRYIESNKNFFIGFMIIIAFLFLSGIYVMIRKINTKN